MTFSCRFFSDGTDYYQPDFAKLMKDSLGDGIVRSIGNELRVAAQDPTAMKVDVMTGRGYIQGYSFDVETEPEELIVTAADTTNPRIDRVVARLSETTNRNITLVVIEGTPAATPTAPTLVRNGDTYDISLAQIYVAANATSIADTNITDERRDSGLCGYAGERHSNQSTTTTLDFTPAPNAISSNLQHHDPCSFNGTMWVKDEEQPGGIYDATNHVVVTSGYMSGWADLLPGTSPTANTIAVSSTEVLIQSSTGRVKGKYSFTISYSDSPGAITYGDLASGLSEQQRRELVREHARHAVVQNGAVNYWLNPSNLNLKTDGTAATLTGADGDVMLLYDPIWWKVDYTANSSLKITFAWYKFADDAICPHTYGNTTASYLGLGVFEGIISSSALRSINSASGPTVNTTEPGFYTAATYGRGARYNVELPMTRALWAILLIFEHGTRDLQGKIGYGRVNTSSAGAVNANWDSTNAWNKGNTGSGSNDGVTAGGIHNPWGDVLEFLGEFIYRDGTSYFSILGGSDHFTITSGYANRPATWHSCTGGTFTTDSFIKEVAGDAYMPFIPKTTGGNSATYYCDNAWQSTGADKCCLVGAGWSNAALAGAFAWGVADAAGGSSSSRGARLQVLIE